MSRPTPDQALKIHEETRSTLRTLLTFHVSFSSLEYIHQDAVNNWRELEERLHINYPIKGVGIKATRTNLGEINEYDGGFLYAAEDLLPEEITSELQSFPYRAASAAYAFTILEMFGDEIAQIVNPREQKSPRSWHIDVSGKANLSVKTELENARKAFATPFLVPHDDVLPYSVQRLVAIKAIRNKIMHEAISSVDFEQFFAYVLSTVLTIYFLVLPTQLKLSVYPYADHENKFV